jgi:hypothetical protein
MTTKLKDKQTSIAKVQDLLRTFATFPAPLLSRYILPLNFNVLSVLVRGLIRKIRQLRRFQNKAHLEDDVKMSWANCPTYIYAEHTSYMEALQQNWNFSLLPWSLEMFSNLFELFELLFNIFCQTDNDIQKY